MSKKVGDRDELIEVLNRLAVKFSVTKDRYCGQTHVTLFGTAYIPYTFTFTFDELTGRLIRLGSFGVDSPP